MSRPRPKPIRLTQSRALALLLAAYTGIGVWEQRIKADLNSGDIEVQREAKALDHDRGEALAAMEIVKNRYRPTTPEPGHPTLDI